MSREGEWVGTGLAEALGFLTVLGGNRAPSERASRWFPVVGLLLGAGLGLIWWGLRHALAPLPAAAVVIAADLGLTGLIHWDGLADAADGLLAPMERSRRLEVMRDPVTGAFGVVTVAAVLLLRWSALSSLGAQVLLLAGLWCLSRAGMTLALAVVPYARPDGGLATAFATTGDRGRGMELAGGAGALIGLVAVAVSRPSGSWIAGVAGGLAAAAGFGAVTALGWRRLGGYTGDVLGAAGVISETVGLVVASAHW